MFIVISLNILVHDVKLTMSTDQTWRKTWNKLQKIRNLEIISHIALALFGTFHLFVMDLLQIFLKFEIKYQNIRLTYGHIVPNRLPILFCVSELSSLFQWLLEFLSTLAEYWGADYSCLTILQYCCCNSSKEHCFKLSILAIT